MSSIYLSELTDFIKADQYKHVKNCVYHVYIYVSIDACAWLSACVYV